MNAVLTSLRMALSALVRQRLRSLLTSIGILIGVAAVVLVAALGAGARGEIDKQIQSLGSNVIFVFSQPSAKSGAKSRASMGMGLTERDAEAIRREATAVTAVTVYSEVKAQLVSEFGNGKIGVMGVDHSYFAVRGYEVATGRRFNESEALTKAKVALIAPTAQTKLFGNQDPVGRWVRVGKHPFQIIGTLRSKGQSPFEDQDDRILIPIGTWRSRVVPTLGDRVQLVMASAKSAEHSSEAERQVRQILLQRHQIAEGEEPDFRIGTQQEFQRMQEGIFTVLTILLLSVAAISLLVGGVGVMNIMLVGVTERTREIGIRMAIGARPADIQFQFLLESIALTLFGGVAGIVVAAILMQVFAKDLGFPMQISLQAIAVAVGTSVIIGLVFGFWPARRAAHLDPIEALHHE
ncbi:MAG: ABC transporter permease [Myxococcales bacterium]|nr:ABC transporter permease [Myxococcales bacterium]